MKKKINLELIKYISLTILNYLAGSVCRRGLAGEGDEEVSGRHGIASSASNGGPRIRGVAGPACEDAPSFVRLRAPAFGGMQPTRARYLNLCF